MAKKKGKSINIDIDYFTDAYCDYINSFNLDKFFEMDVDSIFGYEKVRQLRKKIEQKTGKQPIPVFHKNRGKEEFIAHCKDYPYISLGIAGKDTGWADFSFCLKSSRICSKNTRIRNYRNECFRKSPILFG